jgi:predicted Fe-Mo cluster-binding NifX family protein
MTFKAAVAAQPESMVTQHFGRATVFHVFDVRPDGWQFLESRVNDASCAGDGDRHDSLLARSADLLSDCDAVLAARIGPGAVRSLSERGVEAYAMHALVEDALSALSEELARLEAQPPKDDPSTDLSTDPSTTGHDTRDPNPEV